MKIKSKKTQEKELDEMWSKKVRDRDNYTCQICGKKLEKQHAQAHHIIPRHIKDCRWDTNNGITLCYGCHKVGRFAAHQNPIYFTFWLKTNKYELFRHAIKKLMELGKNAKY